MKKLIVLAVLLNATFLVKAQDEEEEGSVGFKKENLFTGGGLNISFFNGTTALGVSPYFGYSITNWLDAALNLNFNYVSQRDVVVFDDRVRQTTIGPGAFVRLFPVKFLFAQAQVERNFITQKYVPATNSSYTQDKFKTGVNSLLLGIGYASGREQYNKSYYFMSVSVDVLKNLYSPYLDNAGRTIPFINAGFNIALFQGNRRGF